MNLDPKNRAEVYYDRILKQLDDISNGTSDSESGSEGLNPVNRAEMYYKMILDKIDEIADGGSGGDIDPAVIEQAVSDWLTAHPEATTTVADGSITYNKLDANLKGKADTVSSLSDEIDGIGSDVTDLKSAIDDLEDRSDTVTKADYDETALTPDQKVVGKYFTYNKTYMRIIHASYGNGSYLIFHVTAGNRYKAHCYGIDNGSYPCLAIGDADIVESGASYVNMLEYIDVGNEERKYVTFEFVAGHTGYLYLNWQSKSGDSPSLTLMTFEGWTPITDTSLTSPTLPANAKTVGDLLGTVSKMGHGIIKSGDTYTYFKNYKDNNYVLQSISKVGANSLYDYSKGAIGHLSGDTMIEDTQIWAYFTDQIGPFSLKLSSESGNSKWTGGNHTVTYQNQEYQTAEHKTISVKCNGQIITEDGIYFGDADIIVTEALYAPSTITGADLSTATKVIDSTKHFILHDSFRVQVKSVFVEDVDVALYYGLQRQMTHMDNVYLPTAGIDLIRANIQTGKISDSKEWVIFMNNTNYEDNVILHHYALGEWGSNDGTGTIGRICAYSSSKIYYALCVEKTYSAGQSVFWDGEYELKVK